MTDAIARELQPILDAIDASLHGGWRFADRDVSIALPVGAGETVIVSVRAGGAPGRTTPEISKRGLDDRQLRLVYGAIHEKIAEPLSVSMLSSIAGLSRSHFSNAFRARVGRTPHAHIVELRIERAMKLMTDSTISLSEVALAVGFADQAHFSKKFRRATGMTPAQWRRLHR